jgi:hypothetical protein
MDGGRKPKRADYGLGVDEFSGYTEEDYLIGAYELCIGEWGD